MLFSSIIFIFYFFPIVVAAYYLLRFNRTAQNILLFCASLFFYAWGEEKYTFLLLLSIVANTLFGILIEKFRSQKTISKLLLVLMCIFNLGILFLFKYLTFAIANVNALLQTDFNLKTIILPLGISFFTFQAISYVVDVYRGEVSVERNPFYVGLYIAFFPQLIAGPIVRYSTIADQIRNREHTLQKFSAGCCRFVVGLGKKIIIANTMAIVADYVYSFVPNQPVSVALAWLGSIAYTLQIFFDFSAYSDMAIGLGLIFGFKFEENFNYPYVSNSVSEFWRRWHISLTSWFRSYVYFPLGGSRVINKDRMVRNMFVVWFLTGIWHGANWTFILWGLLNFGVILIERFCKLDKMQNHMIPRRIATLLLINFGWVLFRSPDLPQAFQYLVSMFGLSGNALYCPQFLMFVKEYWVFFLLAFVFSTPIARRCNRILVDNRLPKLGAAVTVFYPLTILIMFFICVTFLVKGSYNPFIYFNF